MADVPPDEDQQQNRGTIRVTAPVNIQRGNPNQTAPPQPFQATQDDNPPQQPQTTTVPTNPFGVQTGSSRPGTITPVPQQPQRPRTQADPEP